MIIEYGTGNGQIDIACFTDMTKAGNKMVAIVDAGGFIIQVTAVK